MRILITGAAGMLGIDVGNSGGARGHEVISLARAELDIADAAAVQAQLGDVRPDAVINCAAYTDVDGAESDEAAAQAVNGDGAGMLAAAAHALGAWTIHVSSDYVFDGTKATPYVESDPTGPASAYGRSKLAGELAVARAAPDAHTIVRSSWLFGAGGPCFPKTILRLAAERDELSVVDDQVGCPTFTGHLAEALVSLAGGDGIAGGEGISGEPHGAGGGRIVGVAHGAGGGRIVGVAHGAGGGRIVGVAHVAGGGRCSWYEFAREIVARSGVQCEVKACTTAEFPRPAVRPANSALATERGEPVPRLPHWRVGLEQFLGAGVSSR